MTTITQVGNPPQRIAITIPANTGNGSTIAALLAAAGYAGPTPIAVKIVGKAPNAETDRAAFVVASPRPGAAIATADYTTHGQYVPAGELYYTESDTDVQSYVRSASASTVSALVLVLA